MCQYRSSCNIDQSIKRETSSFLKLKQFKCCFLIAFDSCLLLSLLFEGIGPHTINNSCYKIVTEYIEVKTNTDSQAGDD